MRRRRLAGLECALRRVRRLVVPRTRAPNAERASSRLHLAGWLALGLTMTRRMQRLRYAEKTNTVGDKT